MSPPSDIAVVLCHGGFLTPEPYKPFLESLKATGIDVYCPQLPTSDLTKLNVGDVNNPDFNGEPPDGGYPRGEDDVGVILAILKPLINEQGKRVLVIGHSAGGWLATEASRPELQAHARKNSGLDGGIIGIFYMGAFVVPVGESIVSFTTPKDGTAAVPPPYLQYHKFGAAGLSTVTDPVKFLFNDLEESEARKWAQTMTAGAGVSLTSVLTNDAYAALPCAYLVLDEDAVVPKEFQEMMVGLQSGKTGDFTIYHCPTGHSPHLSWTQGVVDTVQAFIKKIEG